MKAFVIISSGNRVPFDSYLVLSSFINITTKESHISMKLLLSSGNRARACGLRVMRPQSYIYTLLFIRVLLKSILANHYNLLQIHTKRYKRYVLFPAIHILNSVFANFSTHVFILISNSDKFNLCKLPISSSLFSK